MIWNFTNLLGHAEHKQSMCDLVTRYVDCVRRMGVIWNFIKGLLSLVPLFGIENSNYHFRMQVNPQNCALHPPRCSDLCSIGILAQKKPGADADFQPENEISKEVRKMLSDWENAYARRTEIETTSIREEGIQEVYVQVDGAGLLQPPQRYRRVSKRAHLG